MKMTNEEKAKLLVGYEVDTPRNLMRMKGRDEYDILMSMAKWKDQQLSEELNLISDWFKHIAQMADDKKTLNGFIIKDSDAFDEIKCLAKRCAEYIDMHLLNK